MAAADTYARVAGGGWVSGGMAERTSSDVAILQRDGRRCRGRRATRASRRPLRRDREVEAEVGIARDENDQMQPRSTSCLRDAPNSSHLITTMHSSPGSGCRACSISSAPSVRELSCEKPRAWAAPCSLPTLSASRLRHRFLARSPPRVSLSSAGISAAWSASSSASRVTASADSPRGNRADTMFALSHEADQAATTTV